MSEPPPPAVLRDQIGLPFAPVEKAIHALSTTYGLRVTKPASDLVNALLSDFILQLCHAGNRLDVKNKVLTPERIEEGLRKLYGHEPLPTKKGEEDEEEEEGEEEEGGGGERKEKPAAPRKRAAKKKEEEEEEEGGGDGGGERKIKGKGPNKPKEEVQGRGNKTAKKKHRKKMSAEEEAALMQEQEAMFARHAAKAAKGGGGGVGGP